MSNITSPRIQKAIDIFLDAVNGETLAKGTCTACAVGNLVAAGLGGTIQYDSEYQRLCCDKPNDAWRIAFMTNPYNGSQERNKLAEQHPSVMANVEATDFSVNELSAIEYTFETNTRILYEDYPRFSSDEIKADQIKGLSAVIEVMKTFDDQVFSVQTEFVDKLKALNSGM